MTDSKRHADNADSAARRTHSGNHSLAEPGRDEDLSPAIASLEPGKPLVLFDSIIPTDSGHLVTTQYVDVGSTKLPRRPLVLLKAIEARYGLEHSPTLRLSAPHRFRDYGETFIEDDQEGRAARETKTESGLGADGARGAERQRALAALGVDGTGIVDTTRRDAHTDSDARTFGRSCWIYCTSMLPAAHEHASWRDHLSARYDHESVIRQPSRFAQALATMYADQIGPQNNPGHMSQPGGFQSVHDGQMLFHGPVWYTDDVFGFLRELESEPWHMAYAVFVKHIDYAPQREYRFVVHCETAVDNEWLDLHIAGMMRDSLAPPLVSGRARLERTARDRQPAAQTTRRRETGRTTTRTRRTSQNEKTSVSTEGTVILEATVSRETIAALTTQESYHGSDETSGDRINATGRMTERLRRELTVDGAQVELLETAYTRVLGEPDKQAFDESFTLDDLEQVKEVIEAAQRPFDGFASLPGAAIAALTSLAEQVSQAEPEHEVEAMSAAWNAIWAICNLCDTFGDIVASVAIEQDSFVAIDLGGSAHADAEGRLLVGPRGTYAYLLARGAERQPGDGGDDTRLYLFPNGFARDTFAQFGWVPEQRHSVTRDPEDG